MGGGKKVEERFLTDFGRRLKEARLTLKISQKDFAAQMGITGAYLSEIEYGKGKPGFDFFINAARIFNINPNWLFLGKGNMFFTKGIPEQDNLLVGLDDSVLEILKYIKKSPMVKHFVMGNALKFIYENKDTINKDIAANLNSSVNDGSEE